MQLVKEHIARLIKDEALRLGFDDIGFSPAEELSEEKAHLQKWLNKGYHAGMQYMSNHFDKRVNPSKLVEGAKSVITVLKNYYPDNQTLSQQPPKIAKYAYGQDYHEVIRAKLSDLFNYIQKEINPELQGRFFVDSAPLLERSLAVKAGLGWIGKNSLLINRKLGSFVFIGEVVINMELPYASQPMNDACGGCSRCMDACPTQAILPGRTVDANRCISYLTIENKEAAIPEEFREKMNGWAFGCDICQDVCPWNRKAQPNTEDAFTPSLQLKTMQPSDWQAITQEKFSKLFKGSPVKRAKLRGLQRNLSFVFNKNK
jgi:epoxyqueuosine reductase